MDKNNENEGKTLLNINNIMKNEEVIKAIVASQGYKQLLAEKLCDQIRFEVLKDDQESLNQYQQDVEIHLSKIFSSALKNINQSFCKFLKKQLELVYAEIDHEEEVFAVENNTQGKYNSFWFKKNITQVKQYTVHIEMQIRLHFANFQMGNNYFIVHCTKETLFRSMSWNEMRETLHSIDAKDFLNILFLLNKDSDQEQIKCLKMNENLNIELEKHKNNAKEQYQKPQLITEFHYLDKIRERTQAFDLKIYKQIKIEDINKMLTLLKERECFSSPFVQSILDQIIEIRTSNNLKEELEKERFEIKDPGSTCETQNIIILIEREQNKNTYQLSIFYSKIEFKMEKVYILHNQLDSKIKTYWIENINEFINGITQSVLQLLNE